jgi:hypothetical protein
MTAAASPPDTNTVLILGEVRGQLREIIHNMNNQAQKNDAVAAQLAKLEGMPERLSAIETRLVSLETDKHRRDGAMGFGGWLMKSPLIGWLAGFGVAAWAYLTGKLGQ